LSLILFYIGTALFAYYTAQPDLLPAELKVAGSGDKIFPYFIATALPTGIRGLLIASIFAAGMSNISANINGTATIILTDYYKRFFNLQANEKSSMKVLYGSSLIVGALGVTIALSLVGVKSVLDAWWMLASIFSGGMLGLFLLGYLSKYARNIDAVIGTIVGILIIIWMSLSPLYFTEGKLLAFRSPFHEDLTAVFGTMAITLVGFLLASLFAKKAS
jgi:SSS family solute:Na+ symporter